MNRRDLLKPLAALPFVGLAYKGKTVDAVKVGEGENSKYLVFYDARAIDIQGFGAQPIDEHDPLTRSECIPVYLRPGQTVQDVVALYKIPDKQEG